MLMVILLFLLALSTPAAGQQPNEEELAKQSQNPIADLISLPLQSNFNFGAGFHHNKMIYICRRTAMSQDRSSVRSGSCAFRSNFCFRSSEARGTTDDPEYQEAIMVFYRRDSLTNKAGHAHLS
jgi:hypothetical protein